MTELILELTPELYTQLEVQAQRLGKSAQIVAQEWLTERLTAPTNERELNNEPKQTLS